VRVLRVDSNKLIVGPEELYRLTAIRKTETGR
jgi:hypothetical protein